MATLNYRPKGVCARAITIDTKGDIIENVEFQGGCNGNLKAIGKLVKGMTVSEVRELLEGNTCGKRDTSCADQLAKALRTLEA
mgnify:CR=1 FL=1